MDSIKKKMTSLAQATEEATARAEAYERETTETNDLADKFEEQVYLKKSLFHIKIYDFLNVVPK